MIKTPTMQELLEAGVHFGHQVRRSNPRMKQYIYGARDGVHIVDLAQTEKLLNAACEYVYELGKSGKVLLFVGTKKQARTIIQEAAKSAEASYLSEKWIGGFLTNFEEIGKNIKKMKDLKEKGLKGELSKYTKKEQLLMSRKVEKLEKIFEGAVNLTEIPEAVFIVDTVAESTATRECQRVGVKVVAIADTNSDPLMIDYPIPGNDDAIKSITIITQALAKAYGEGKKEAGKVALKKAEKDAEEAKTVAAKSEEVLPEEIKLEVAEVEEEVEKEVVKESERVV